MHTPLATTLATAIRGLYFGNNWTGVCLAKTLEDVSLKEATQQVHGSNSIALLAYHIHYYIQAALPVLQGGALTAHDKFAFSLPPLANEEAWKAMLRGMYDEAEQFAALVEAMPEGRLYQMFTDPKYSTYLYNIMGTVEHSYYHLGQIALLKKMVRYAV